MATDRERRRKLAQALLDGSARRVDTVELCNLILAEPEHEGPLTDAELAALGALSITEAIDKEIHPTRRVTSKRLRAELERRGVLP